MYDTLEAIIPRITSPHARMIWVGKEYSKADLRADLARIADGISIANDILTGKIKVIGFYKDDEHF